MNNELNKVFGRGARALRSGLSIALLCAATGFGTAAQAQPSFGAATNFGVGTQPRSVAVADVNNDGKPDFLTANNGGNNVSVRLGDGTGSFGAPTNFGVGSGPVSVAVADVNLDGKPDFLAANGNSSNVSVCLGNGAGNFGAATNFGIGTQPISVAVGDFNNDDKPDFLTANFNTNNVSVCLGDGTGSFGAPTNFGVGSGPVGVAVADVNLDGKPDFLTTNAFSNNVSVCLGDGTGSFGAATDFGIGINSESVAVADVNLDGKPDFLAVNTGGTSVSVCLGDGTGNFGAATDFTAGTGPRSVAVADVNLDGKPDFLTANFSSNNVSVCLGDGTGSFGAATNFTAGSTPFGVAVADVNLDGKPDFLAANSVSNDVSVALNTTPVTLNPFGTATNFGVGFQPVSVAVADVNNDGNPDFLTANYGGANVSVRLGNGAGSFGAATNFGVGIQPLSVAVADVNNDGKPDLLTANQGSGNVTVRLGNGAGSFGAATNFSVGTNPQSVAVADVNLDGKPDFLAANSSGNVSVCLGNGAGSFGAATNFSVGGGPSSVVVADVNNDGKPDFLAANGSTDNVSVCLGDGTGSFGAATNFTVGNGPSSVVVADVNLDGKPDFLVANSIISDNVTVRLGDGAGSFGAATDFPVGISPNDIAVADVNLDGKPDLLTANLGGNTVSVCLGNGAGSFGAATNFSVGTQPYSVAVADVNNDGKPDFLAANGSNNNVSVVLNNVLPITTFTPTPIPGGITFNAIVGTASGAFITVGNAGQIRYTTNNGSTWLTKPSGTGNNLFSIAVGNNFDPVLTASRGAASVQAPTALGTAISCGVGGTILRTTTGGDSWINENDAIVPDVDLRGIAVADGIVAGKGTAVQAPSALGTAISCGVGGTILRSIDGGENWTVENSTGADLNAVAVTNDFDFTAKGASGIQAPTALGTAISCGVGGTILRSTDGGDTWTPITTSNTNTLNGISIFGDATARKGSSTQAALQSGQSPTALGTAISCGVGGTILRSTDGGQTWTTVSSGTSQILRSVQMATEQIGYISGDNGTLLRTTDAGLSWVNLSVATGDGLNAIAVQPATGIGIAVGTNGTAFTTLNGGSSVGDNPLPVELTAFSGSATDLTTGLGVKLNWTTASETNNAGFVLLRNSIAIADYRSDVSLTGKGTTTATTQYAFTDAAVETGKVYTYTLRSVDLSGTAHDYPQSVTVEVRPSANTVSKYELFQNYPNPFNPETVIRYSMKSAGIATLKIYDVLGRVVLNEPIASGAGDNRYRFNAAKLASGLYFYQLRVSDDAAFLQTRKMTVLK